MHNRENLSVNFITSPNIILWRILDSSSKWEFFVSGHLFSWLSQEIEITPNKLSLLEQYKQIRAPFDWEAQPDLLRWAHTNFPNHPQFNSLKPIFDEFKTWETNSGVSLLKLAEEVGSQVNEEITKIAAHTSNYKLETIITKARQLFNEATTDNNIDCFACWSPLMGKMQGGADGDGIVIEVNINPKPEIFELVVSLLLHEVFHKAVKVQAAVEQWSELSSIANNFYPNIQQGNLEVKYLIDELVTYSCVNIYLLGTSVASKVEEYSTRVIKGEEHLQKYLQLWKYLQQFYPIVDNYLAGKVTVPETRQQLVEFTRSLVSNF